MGGGVLDRLEPFRYYLNEDTPQLERLYICKKCHTAFSENAKTGEIKFSPKP